MCAFRLGKIAECVSAIPMIFNNLKLRELLG